MSIETCLSRAALNGETMGTRYSAVFYAPGARDHADLATSLHAAISRVDDELSNWKPQSAICRLNQCAPGAWFDAPDSLMSVLEAALKIEAASNGAFDIGVAQAVAAWGFGPQAAVQSAVVPPADLKPAAPRAITREALELDPRNRRVRKHAPLALDLSGIAKGYGVDCLGAVLSEAGITDWLVGIDGEMRAKGTKPDGSPWAIGLEKPVPGVREVEGVVELTDLAIATSGTYRHFRDMAGQRFSHTIDPSSGRPIEHALASVTVLAASCMAADAWATALLVDGHWPPRGFARPPGIERVVT